VSARRLIVLAAAAVLAACNANKPAPRAAQGAAPVAAAAAASPSPAQAKPAETPEWSYSSVGKRDPFRSFRAELEKSGGALATRCATPLGKFELEQLKLVAIVTGLEDPVAMLEAPTGVGYSVRRGACIGKNGGTVASVRSGEIVVSEWAIRADGSRDRTQTVVRMAKEAALNLEELP
jgi:type IV pilus assembly protein PilP